MLVLGQKKYHGRGQMNTGQHTGFGLFCLVVDGSTVKEATHWVKECPGFKVNSGVSVGSRVSV